MTRDLSRDGAPPIEPRDLNAQFDLAPGEVTRHLARFVNADRRALFERILDHRTSRLRALLDNVCDPHNVSACVRSCEAFGIQHIHVVPQPGLDLLLNREVAIGTQKWVTIHRHESISVAISVLKNEGFRLLHTGLSEAHEVTSLAHIQITGPLCVIFGSELYGVSETAIAASDGGLNIPIHGFAQSLNISVALALTMYDLRQKQIAQSGSPGDLDPNERVRILDRWIGAQVPRAEIVLADMLKRDKTD